MRQLNEVEKAIVRYVKDNPGELAGTVVTKVYMTSTGIPWTDINDSLWWLRGRVIDDTNDVMTTTWTEADIESGYRDE